MAYTFQHKCFSAPQTDKVNARYEHPVSQLTRQLIGITALLALGILECMQEQGRSKPLLEMDHNSPEYLHALIEALRCVPVLLPICEQL
jgi:hypothetical protein